MLKCSFKKLHFHWITKLRSLQIRRCVERGVNTESWSFKKFCSGKNLGILQVCVCLADEEVGNSQKLGE